MRFKQKRKIMAASIVALMALVLVPVGMNAVEVTTFDLIPEGQDKVTISDSSSWQPMFDAPSNVDMATLTVIGRLVLANEDGAQWSMKVYVNDNEIVANDLLVDPQTHYCPNHPSFQDFWENSYYNNVNTGVLAWDLAYDSDFDADAPSTSNYYRPRTDVYEYRWAITAHVTPGSSNTVEIENVNSYGYTIELAKAVVDVYKDDASSVKWSTENDISVQSYKDNFDDGSADGWTEANPESCNWHVDSGVYVQDDHYYIPGCRVTSGGSGWTDYTMLAKVKVDGNTGGRWGGIVLRASDDGDTYYEIYLQEAGYLQFTKTVDGTRTWPVGVWTDMRVYIGAFYNEWWYVKGEVIGDTIRGKAWQVGTSEPYWLYEWTDSSSPITSGKIGLITFSTTGQVNYDDIKVTGLVDVYFTSSFKVDDATSGTEYGVTMKVKNLVSSDTTITITDVSLRPHAATPKSASASLGDVDVIPNDGIELPADGTTTASFVVYMTPEFTSNHATVHLWIEFKTVCDDVYKVGVNVMFRT